MYDFEGETVLVTGGTRGIGKEAGRLFLEHGATVVLNYHDDDEAAEQARSDLSSTGPGEVHLGKFDVADEVAVDEAVEAIWEEYGPIRHLVNNAGVLANVGPLVGMERDDWDSVVDVNLGGAFNVVRAVGKRMVLAGIDGSIVNVSSITARRGFPGEIHYGASKGGLVSMTRALARELGRRNIRVNVVLPGYTKTSMADTGHFPGADFEDFREKELSRVPLERRMADPEEVAEVIVFVASDRASYMTGSEIRVDGGRLA
ncbi:short-chain dehydrogenase [Halobacteriales archaeon QS_1_68_20]|nr:MAG: short-chain dehydrogenase [Halobacteriales archaeon QS_1_68_20]